ncbi:MAG: hypothetical protein CO189_11840 [candidate division Zixibacteria bacterium CG_4_9_14_3_um_filter_46_8]|nr:MAG: hypothetical protein CO189_11840 [candidate division Zixibacteria bacterium CG_4_9_14_3_um_filter_46_8]
MRIKGVLMHFRLFILIALLALFTGGCGGPGQPKFKGTVVTTLPDLLCRFLMIGDVDADGQNEMVASPMKSGVWVLDYDKGQWSKKVIDENSSGFEHAALIADLENDGKYEIYAAADDQGALKRYLWNGSRFDIEEIAIIEKDLITFGVMPGKKTPCGQNESEMPDLVMTQAQFHSETNADGKEESVPGAARMVLLYRNAGGWRSEIVEDSESNVFHKAIAYQDAEGPCLLTIGANAAILKQWRHKDGKWEGTILYQDRFGGSQDRLRDFEIGDVTGDGKDDIVIATHDQGVVLVLEEKQGQWEATEIDRKPNTFVHEIELGDFDHDGKMEIFATPSEPNKLDGTIQPGLIVMYKYDGKGFKRSVVEEFPTRHVKEILLGDIDQDSQLELYCAVEGEISKLGSGEGVLIKQYRLK